MIMSQVFDHIIIVMFENEYRSYVMQNPYMRRLATQGVDLANYFGTMHPSQTNYIASIAGELCNVTYDDPPWTEPKDGPSGEALGQDTIVDRIEKKGLDWRAYMDSYVPQLTCLRPSNPFPRDQFPYVIKHNPFSSFARPN